MPRDAVALIVLVLLAAPAVSDTAGPGSGETVASASAATPGPSQRTAFDLLTRLAEIPARIDGADQAAERAMSDECLQLDRRCLRYLRDHPADAERALPDNPAYWRTYRAVLEAGPVARTVEDLETRGSSELVNAERNWPRYQLLTRGALDAADVHFRVTTYRRLLAESQFLIDKMISTATAATAFQNINVLMAQAGVQPSPAETRALDQMLEPLSTAELSFAHALDGERHYARAMLARYPKVTFDPLIRSDVARYHEFVADRSEAGWQSYWQRGLDALSAVPGVNAMEGVPGATYLNNVRYLDALLHVLRALRPMYEGRAVPGIPATPAPALWYWAWRDDPEALCLEAGAVHPSLGTPEPMCVPYLGGR